MYDKGNAIHNNGATVASKVLNGKKVALATTSALAAAAASKQGKDTKTPNK